VVNGKNVLRLIPMLGVVVLAVQPGCRRSEEVEPGRPVSSGPDAVVDFPERLQPDDPAVTAFVRRAIDTCVKGDYDAFRLLWSVREDPFPRDSFERGWRAVQRVTVLDIQKLLREVEGDVVYGVHAAVELDESVPEPKRQVVLLIVHEADQWRLMSAPANLRRRFLGTEEASDAAAGAPASQPATASQPVPTSQASTDS